MGVGAVAAARPGGAGTRAHPRSTAKTKFTGPLASSFSDISEVLVTPNRDGVELRASDSRSRRRRGKAHARCDERSHRTPYRSGGE